jgi:hypothetical protein
MNDSQHSDLHAEKDSERVQYSPHSHRVRSCTGKFTFKIEQESHLLQCLKLGTVSLYKLAPSCQLTDKSTTNVTIVV